MLPLTLGQLIEHGKEPGTCKFCGGKVIMNDTITNENTIIVRRYKNKNKNYWEDTKEEREKEIKKYFKKLPEESDPNYKKYEWYIKFVIDSGKKARPELLTPKSHPDGLCAPCCFKFKEGTNPKNIENCIVHSVDSLIDVSKLTETEIKESINRISDDSSLILLDGKDIELTSKSMKTGVFIKNSI